MRLRVAELLDRTHGRARTRSGRFQKSSFGRWNTTQASICSANAARRTCLRVVSLSRNLPQSQSGAALDHNVGDVVIVMDADLARFPRAISIFSRVAEVTIVTRSSATKESRCDFSTLRSTASWALSKHKLLSKRAISADCQNEVGPDSIVPDASVSTRLRTCTGSTKRHPTPWARQHSGEPKLQFAKLFRLASMVLHS